MLAEPDRGRRRAACPHRQPQFRQSRSGRRSWASWSGRSAASARRRAPSPSRSSQAMCRSTTRPTASPFRRLRRSAASGSSPTSAAFATLAFKAEGEIILLAGAPPTWGTHLGQSVYLREILGREDGPPPPVDLAHEKRVGDFVRGLIREGKVTAVHDLSDGGLAVALAEMAIASGIGATIDATERGLAARDLLRRGPGPLPDHGRARRPRRASRPGQRRRHLHAVDRDHRRQRFALRRDHFHISCKASRSL